MVQTRKTSRYQGVKNVFKHVLVTAVLITALYVTLHDVTNQKRLSSNNELLNKIRAENVEASQYIVESE